MKVLVVGAGLSGCTIARLLQDKGHEVLIIEKKGRIGGLCVTEVNQDGIPFEPYGARTFHASDENIWDFITSFSPFNGYVHCKGMIIKGNIFPFPLSREDIGDFEDCVQIRKELSQLTGVLDATNFETAALSIFGETLYKYFIENYSRKMWACNLRDLSSVFAPKRLELRSSKNQGEGCLFVAQRQGLPCGGYSRLLENMVQGIDIRLNVSEIPLESFDLVLSTAPIDELFKYRFGRLRYRSLRFNYVRDEYWERSEWGTINLPDHLRYIRKCNFKVLHKFESEHNWIQYQEPVEADSLNEPMYPVHTSDNEILFQKYLKDATKTNIIPLGRLGLFKYLDMDKAVSCSFEIFSLADRYQFLSSEERCNALINIRDRY